MNPHRRNVSVQGNRAMFRQGLSQHRLASVWVQTAVGAGLPRRENDESLARLRQAVFRKILSRPADGEIVDQKQVN